MYEEGQEHSVPPMSEEQMLLNDPERSEEFEQRQRNDNDSSSKPKKTLTLYAIGLVLFFSIAVVLSVLIFGGTDSNDQNRQLLTNADAPKKKNKVLIIVDIQKDFISGSLGAFKVGDITTQETYELGDNKNPYTGETAKKYGEAVAKYLGDNLDTYAAYVYSIDFHPEGHCSFATTNPTKCWINGNQGPNQQTDTANWPEHCLQTDEERGADLWYQIPRVAATEEGTEFGDIIVAGNGERDIKRYSAHRGEPMDEYELYVTMQKFGPASSGSAVRRAQKRDTIGEDRQTNPKVFWLFKGLKMDVDSYSAFFGNHRDLELSQMDHLSTGLAKALNENGFNKDNTEIHVLGIAYDFCVKSTAKDAKLLGYDTTFIRPLTVPADLWTPLKSGDPRKGIDQEMTREGIHLKGENKVADDPPIPLKRQEP